MDLSLFEQMARMEDRHWWFLGRRHVVIEMVGELGLPSDSLVVDIGCGTGANAAALARSREGEGRVVGVDPTPEAIELAGRFDEPGLRYLHGAVEDLGAEMHGAADLVLLLDVIEHVEDDAGLLRSALDLLPPGGWLVVTVPADPRLWSPHDEVHGHYRRYTPESLGSVLAPLPLEVRLLSCFNARLYPLIRVVRMLKRRRTRGRAVRPDEGSDLSLPPNPVNRLLTKIFGGEAGPLVSGFREGAPPYSVGASLLAVARKTSSDVEGSGD